MICVNVKDSAMERFHQPYVTVKYRKSSPGRIQLLLGLGPANWFHMQAAGTLRGLDSNMGREMRDSLKDTSESD